MTAFASGQIAPREAALEGHQAGRVQLDVELRSVNSRFLDLSLRLPDELRHHEPVLRELLVRCLRRGKVELRAFVQRRDSGAPSVLQELALQQLARLQAQVQAHLPDVQPLRMTDVLRLAASDGSVAADTLQDALLPLTEQVLTQLMEARAREGARLTALLQERLTGLRSLVGAAAPLLPELAKAQQQRFLDRWHEAAGLTDAAAKAPSEVLQERALAEATAYAMRLDVAEELGRLQAHLAEIERNLSKGGEIGKRVEFLIQELHREANTLGSKSASLELTRIAVDMKVLIEQMREQIQNIE